MDSPPPVSSGQASVSSPARIPGGGGGPVLAPYWSPARVATTARDRVRSQRCQSPSPAPGPDKRPIPGASPGPYVTTSRARVNQVASPLAGTRSPLGIAKGVTTVDISPAQGGRRLPTAGTQRAASPPQPARTANEASLRSPRSPAVARLQRSGQRPQAARSLGLGEANGGGGRQVQLQGSRAGKKRQRPSVGSEGLESATRRAHANLFTRQSDPVAAAARSGRKLDTNCFLVEDLEVACNELILFMPEDWLIEMMGEDKADFDSLDPDQVLSWFHNHAKSKLWNAPEVRKCKAGHTYVLERTGGA
jgi:hypothetical protein